MSALPTSRSSSQRLAQGGPPSSCSHLKLRRLMRLVSRHYDRHLAACGLKTTQYSLLMAVASRGPLQQSELARILGLDASTLTRNLRPLVDAGMLAVSQGEDGRSNQVRITRAGLGLRNRARRRWQQAQDTFDRTVGAERVAALHDLLDSCQRLLADDSDRRTATRGEALGH